MSTLPTSMVGSILQSPLTQQQVSTVRDSERVQRSVAQRQQVTAATEHDSTVETADNDTEVHTDSEGQGSQGRAFSEPEEETPTAEPAPNTLGDFHLIDFEA
jgi:hypothetical protein